MVEIHPCSLQSRFDPHSCFLLASLWQTHLVQLYNQTRIHDNSIQLHSFLFLLPFQLPQPAQLPSPVPKCFANLLYFFLFLYISSFLLLKYMNICTLINPIYQCKITSVIPFGLGIFAPCPIMQLGNFPKTTGSFGIGRFCSLQ